MTLSRFLMDYSKCVSNGMQHPEIARYLNMPLGDYYAKLAREEMALAELGEFIPSPQRVDKRVRYDYRELDTLLPSES